MNCSLRTAALAVVAGMMGVAAMRPATAFGAVQEQVASVQQLETQALAEAKIGHFDRTHEILGKAADVSHDPTVVQLATWTNTFKSQLTAFAAERHKQYDELVTQAKMLIDHGKSDYAMEVAARAFSLADSKDAFRQEAWVDKLIAEAVQRADKYDQSEQWVRSLRLYADLSILEPAIPAWKDRLKGTTRHVRLLAMYAMDSLKAMQDSETVERLEVEKLLHPTTQPAATQAATQPATPDATEKSVNDAFKVDWHETLKGVKINMLSEALEDAETNYYRGITFRDMATGGLKAVRAVVLTKGLDKAFPKLADESLRNDFLKALNDFQADNEKATGPTARAVLNLTLKRLQTKNHDTIDLPAPVLVSEFADGAFEPLDQFTSMIWPSDLEEFNKATQGRFSGVGVQIQTDDDGSLRVVTPLEDTPAYKAGIKAGDVIAEIDGKSAKHISVNQAVRIITGPPDSLVTLTVQSPDGKSKEYKLKRETIHVASVKGYVHRPGGGWDYMVDAEQKIGYIRITNFTGDTSDELNSAIDAMKLKNVRGIIMDLRYNPGGLLTAATDVADKFLDHGLIVSTRPDRNTGNQPWSALAKPSADDCNLPLVVLVNQYSASASEIVSGALKDDSRALVVGERTFGKGSVQMLFPLTDRTAYLKLTTSHYYLPSGRCIHREENSKEWGVDPDVTVAMTPDQMRAAIDAREELDVLREIAPAAGGQPKLEQVAKDASAKSDAGRGNKKDLLSSDPQMSAALLLLRLQLASAPS